MTLEKIRSLAEALCAEMGIAFAASPEAGKFSLYRDPNGTLQFIRTRSVNEAGEMDEFTTPFGVNTAQDDAGLGRILDTALNTAYLCHHLDEVE